MVLGMKQHRILASLLGIALLTGAAQAAPREASIPFVNHGGIRDWTVAKGTLYIRGSHGNWYRAELMSPCTDLPFAQRIGFETRGSDTFDKFSSIRVDGRSCQLKSLVASEPPPRKARKAKRG